MKRFVPDDNRGLTLIELMIGVTILAIIIVPLLKVFILGAATSLKSRNYSAATEEMQNLTEKISACDIDALLSDKTTISKLSNNANFYTAKTDSKGKVSYDLSGTAAPAADSGKYYIGIKNVPIGTKNYDEFIILNGSLSANNASVCVSNNMDALLSMTTADDNALSALQAQFGSYFSDLSILTLSGISRTITITASKSGNFYDINAVFDYSGNVSYTVSSTVKTESFSFSDSSTSRISAAGSVTIGKPLFSVFLLFKAYYTGPNSPIDNITEHITINNNAGGDFNVFLADVTKNPTVSPTYSALIKYDYQYDYNVPRVFTNINNNGSPNNVVYRAYDYNNHTYYISSSTLQSPLAITGNLTEEKTLKHEYAVSVYLYNSGSGFTGTPVASLNSTKAD